jgi:hypothetical protein
MRIDWGALLPADRAADPQPAPPVHRSVPVATAGAAIDDEREAWEERAAILEYEAGFDRATAEAMATAEHSRRLHADKWADRAGDDRRLCPECDCYQDRRCTIAKPGGLVSAARGYMPVSDLLRRCEGFAPLPDDPDQRPGVDRWPWLLQPPYRPASAGASAPRQPAQSPSGRASA